MMLTVPRGQQSAVIPTVEVKNTENDVLIEQDPLVSVGHNHNFPRYLTA